MNEDALRTRLCEEYGCEYPIVAFCHTKEVVAAVTNAGGIGVLGTTQLKKDEFRATCAGSATRSATSRSASTRCCPPPSRKATSRTSRR